MILKQAAGQAIFSADRMGKVNLAGGEYLYAGLNCFEPGQEHAAHVHADQDKLYVVLEGSGEATLGEQRAVVTVGDVILAQAGIEHSLRAMETRLVVLVVFGPPPKRKSG